MEKTLASLGFRADLDVSRLIGPQYRSLESPRFLRSFSIPPSSSPSAIKLLSAVRYGGSPISMREGMRLAAGDGTRILLDPRFAFMLFQEKEQALLWDIRADLNPRPSSADFCGQLFADDEGQLYALTLYVSGDWKWKMVSIDVPVTAHNYFAYIDAPVRP